MGAGWRQFRGGSAQLGVIRLRARGAAKIKLDGCVRFATPMAPGPFTIFLQLLYGFSQLHRAAPVESMLEWPLFSVFLDAE